jgi:hypothetical protein
MNWIKSKLFTQKRAQGALFIIHMLELDTNTFLQIFEFLSRRGPLYARKASLTGARAGRSDHVHQNIEIVALIP